MAETTETPWQTGRETGVTIKFGKDYDAPWVTFRGVTEEIRAALLATFGMEDNPELSLAALVVNATKEAHAMYGVSSGLGGRVVGQSGNRRGGGFQRASQTDTETKGEAKPEEPAENPLLAQIEAATDEKGLKRLWAQNQEAFKDPEVMNAWKAKGKALIAAAAK
ncbi:hypothetical protein [Plantactinospora sp. WMMB782]|uniref:hypothetical protein n=1 Tax=Plantactinospora sp. WMMB782 TaxID=3404121 RepID=UPI003B92BC99